MRYQLLVCADDGGRAAEECAVVPTAQSVPGGAAGTAGLQWLWELVELHLGQEPDTAA